MPERFWIPVQTYAADGGARPNSGGAPFRQPCPAYPSTTERKAPQARFSEESLRTRTSIRKQIFSKAQLQVLCAHQHAESRSAQQAWMNSRNQTTITSAREHRQPGFLHPRDDGQEGAAAAAPDGRSAGQNASSVRISPPRTRRPTRQKTTNSRVRVTSCP